MGTELDRELIKGTVGTIVLAALNRREMYGYELIKSIGERSGGKLALKEGSLYPILHALEKDGAIASRWEETESARKRRFYRITASGRKVLARKEREWTDFRGVMDRLTGAT